MEGCKILVVDDSKDFRFLLDSLLKFHKISVHGVSNATEAIDLCGTNPYSLIISDYIMEGMDGLGLAQQIRSAGLNRECPMILMTAKNLEADELTTLNRLSITYIKKPILPNELYRKVTDILGRKT